jgi:hypothetical protein
MRVGDVEPLVLGMEPRRNHRRRSAYRAVCVLATIDPQLSPATVIGPVSAGLATVLGPPVCPSWDHGHHRCAVGAGVRRAGDRPLLPGLLQVHISRRRERRRHIRGIPARRPHLCGWLFDRASADGRPVAVMRSAISAGRTTRWGGRCRDRWPGRQGSRRRRERI